VLIRLKRLDLCREATFELAKDYAIVLQLRHFFSPITADNGSIHGIPRKKSDARTHRTQKVPFVEIHPKVCRVLRKLWDCLRVLASLFSLALTRNVISARGYDDWFKAQFAPAAEAKI
jgi:hypothetical protein